MAHTRRLFGVAALVTLSGCAGFQEAYETRVCWSEGLAAQCDSAFVEFRCVDQIETLASTKEGIGATLATRVVKRLESPRAGELFSQRCPPECIPILVKGGSPSETLDRNAREILQHVGYKLTSDPTLADGLLRLDLTFVDVRSEDPGWFKMKLTTRATTSFSARLEAPEGEVIWTQTFNGTEEIKHWYASLRDSERILGRAYCQALSSFAQAVAGNAFREK